jgi:hypothetical protein
MKTSKFWLTNNINSNDNFNLIELANTQRAISNFVKIQTGKDIPVEFISHDGGDSMTDGKKIVISSTINTHNLDAVVGTALHEAAHCKHTDFFVLKKIANRLLEGNLMGGRRWVEMLLNFIEDRRIDNLTYHNAPGYQDYYRSMYERYFYSKVVDKGLKSKEYREENWEHYMFRIINMFNKNADQTALQVLPTIYKMIDLKNIDRLKNTRDSLELAITIYRLINKHFSSKKKPKPNSLESNLESKPNFSNPGDNKGPSKEEIKKAFSKQEEFLKGNVHKVKTSKKEKQQIEAISKSKVDVKNVKATDSKGIEHTDIPVHVIDGITPVIIESNLYEVFGRVNLMDKQIDEGVAKGKKLLRKLRIRNEQITLQSNRLKSGKIDPRRIHAASFEEDLFYKIDRANYKPISLHVSIDGSGSMFGVKWNQTLINTIALGYISLHMNNIDLTISIRTTGKDLSKSSMTAHVPLLILAFNSKKHTMSDLRRLGHYKTKGLTPEGMCLNALNEYIPNSSYYLDSYLINMSDGYPTFEKQGKFTYKGTTAILDTAKAVKNIKKKGVNILSYFIKTPTTQIKEEELIENFQIMYGKEASFIDPKNMHEVTKTLNNLFLKQNLVS